MAAIAPVTARQCSSMHRGHAYAGGRGSSNVLVPCVAGTACLHSTCQQCCASPSCCPGAAGLCLQVALKLDQHHQLELWARLGNVLLVDGLLPANLEGSIRTALQLSNATHLVRSSPLFS